MRKRVLFYMITMVSFFSLQSCVTNYVVSTPTKYKKDTNLVQINTNNLTAASKSTYNSINLKLANVQKPELVSIITNTISLDEKIDDVLREANTYLGTPYRFGGTTRSGIDCSAFVLNVFGEIMGIELPRIASEQAGLGEKVEKEELQKGDLVFFSKGRRISHVGIVQEVSPEGDIKFIHASTSRGVMISSLDDSYWGRKFRFAKRIIKQPLQDQTN